MKNDDMDRAASAFDGSSDETAYLLASHFAADDEIVPSSGFVPSVMEAIRAETSAPPPIAFPWRRVMPGAVAVVCALAGFATVLLRNLRATVAASPAPSRAIAINVHAAALSLRLTPAAQTTCWAAIAACLSLAVAMASMRLAGSAR